MTALSVGFACDGDHCGEVLRDKRAKSPFWHESRPALEDMYNHGWTHLPSEHLRHDEQHFCPDCTAAGASGRIGQEMVERWRAGGGYEGAVARRRESEARAAERKQQAARRSKFRGRR